ncbi:MAG: DUF4388 domain-containing protein [Deltaproteobacteria bacterium]|nr:DUF4388 domain-containing protein [Deltaproteobacteria bacterium]
MPNPEFVNQDELLNSILHISPRVNWDTLKLNELEAFILSRATGILTVREIIEQTSVDIKQALSIINDYLVKGILLIEKKQHLERSDFSLSGLKRAEQKVMLKKIQEIKSFENFEIKFPFGELSEYHFPKILMFAIYSKLSGKIEVESDGKMRIIGFDNGMVCEIKNLPIILEECLGRIMLQKGEITYEQYQESLKLMARSHKRQGEILIQMKAATEKSIENALRLQAEVKLTDLFGWENGEYRIKPNVKVNKSFTGGVDIVATIYSGVKEKSSLERVRREIKGVQLLNYEFTNPTIFEHLKKIVKGADSAIINYLEKNKSGNINELLTDKSALAYMMVYILLLLGIIRVKR